MDESDIKTIADLMAGGQDAPWIPIQFWPLGDRTDKDIEDNMNALAQVITYLMEKAGYCDGNILSFTLQGLLDVTQNQQGRGVTAALRPTRRDGVAGIEFTVLSPEIEGKVAIPNTSSMGKKVAEKLTKTH